VRQRKVDPIADAIISLADHDRVCGSGRIEKSGL